MGTRARSVVGAVLLCGLLAVLTVPASGQEASVRSGTIYLPTENDNLTVAPGGALTLAPGTRVHGQGHIVVHGSLHAAGTPEEPVNVSVPVIVLGDGLIVVEHARFWAVRSNALELRAGQALVNDSLFEGNGRAILAAGSARLDAKRAIFRDHVGEAVYLEGEAHVAVRDSTFSENGRGITLYSARELHVRNSSFVGNAQHLVANLGPWTALGADVLLEENSFGATTPSPAGLPGVALRHDAPLEPDRAVRLVANRFSDAPIGLRAEGRALQVHSQNDTFEDNAVGVSVQQASVRLENTRLGNDVDVAGSGTVTLESVTYLRPTSSPPGGAAAPVAWLPWALGAGALVLVGVVALVVGRSRRAAPSEVIVVSAPAAPPEPIPSPGPDLAVPISPLERRILEDVIAHPGTAQRAIADRLGYTRQALHYHVKKLESRGLIEKTVEGRETHCFVPDPVVGALSSTLVTRTGSQEKA